MHNIKYQCHMAACCQLTELLAAKQEPYKIACFFTKNIEEFSGKSSGEWASRQKKNKTERVTRLSRKKQERRQ